jgi:putative peptidoglycan lipid II flippase
MTVRDPGPGSDEAPEASRHGRIGAPTGGSGAGHEGADRGRDAPAEAPADAVPSARVPSAGERFEAHSRTFALVTLLSRVTGLARDATLSRVFGAGSVMDAFFFAFLVPNLFRRLFGEGAMAAAFLPEYARLEHQDPATARRLATVVVAGLAVVLGAVVLGIEALLWAGLRHGGEEGGLALRLTMVMLPYMPMVCVVAILGAMLQVHGRFGPTAAAPIVLNLGLVAAAVGAPIVWRGIGQSGHVSAVAWAVIAAGVLQVAWALWALRGQRWVAWGPGPARAPALRVLRRAGPMILGLGVFQLNSFLDGIIAGYPSAVGETILGVPYPLREGAMAAVSFAQRLYQFPLGVFGVAVATAIFPAMSRAAGVEALGDLVRRGLRLVVFIGLPASAGLLLVAGPLASVILRGGVFGAADADRVAFVLCGYASAIWAYSMTHVLTRAFYARGDPVTPLRVAMLVVGLNLLLNCLLIWTPLREAGLAWSTALSAVVQVLLLLRCARRHASPIDGAVLRSWLRTALATALMAAGVLLLRALLPEPQSWAESLGWLLGTVGCGVAVVAAAALLLRMPELRWAAGRSG